MLPTSKTFAEIIRDCGTDNQAWASAWDTTTAAPGALSEKSNTGSRQRPLSILQKAC